MKPDDESLGWFATIILGFIVKVTEGAALATGALLVWELFFR